MLNLWAGELEEKGRFMFSPHFTQRCVKWLFQVILRWFGTLEYCLRCLLILFVPVRLHLFGQLKLCNRHILKRKAVVLFVCFMVELDKIHRVDPQLFLYTEKKLKYSYMDCSHCCAPNPIFQLLHFFPLA